MHSNLKYKLAGAIVNHFYTFLGKLGDLWANRMMCVGKQISWVYWYNCSFQDKKMRAKNDEIY